MMVSIGEGRWRTLRRLYLAGGEADWSSIRQWTRKGKEEDRDVLADMGLITDAGSGRVKLTAKGKEVQELGEVEVVLGAGALVPTPPTASKPALRGRKPKAKKK